MCARFTVLSDTPIAAAIAGCVIPPSRNSTIWMRWRCAAGIFQRNAVFSRRTSALLHLTICFFRIRCASESHLGPRYQAPVLTWKKLDSSRYGTGIRLIAELERHIAAFDTRIEELLARTVPQRGSANSMAWPDQAHSKAEWCANGLYFAF